MIHTGLAVLIVLLCETAGLWFLNTQMTIPAGREIAANWVFQFSIIACALSVICVPYDAEIIAHEKMGIFAFIQILQSTLNLVIVYAVKYYSHDKLIFYAFLLLMVQVLNRIIYGIYCGRNFPETKFHIVKDKELFKEMTGFAGWNLFGNLAYVCYSQGQNILLNMYLGPVVNAARGVALSVQTALSGFVTNFQMALNPQITKSYAREDFDRLHKLIYSSSKLSFCLLWCMALPVLYGSDILLSLWLKDVPDHASNFLRLIVIIMLFSTLDNPITVANSATGKIKAYQIAIGGILLSIIPLSYIALRIWCVPEVVFLVQLFCVVIAQVVRVFMVKQKLKLSVRTYINGIVFPCSIVIMVSLALSYPIYALIPQTTIGFLVVSILTAIVGAITSFYIALNRKERNLLLSKLPILKNFTR